MEVDNRFLGGTNDREEAMREARREAHERGCTVIVTGPCDCEADRALGVYHLHAPDFGWEALHHGQYTKLAEFGPDTP